MGRVVALGYPLVVDAFALGGASPLGATSPAEVRRCWEALPEDTTVVILTAAAAEALGERVRERPAVLTVAMAATATEAPAASP